MRVAWEDGELGESSLGVGEGRICRAQFRRREANEEGREGREKRSQREEEMAAASSEFHGRPSGVKQVFPGDSSWSPAAGEVNLASIRRHQENGFYFSESHK